MASSVADQTLKHLLLRIVSGAASLIWWLLLAVVVLLALYAGIGRQVTQNINEYRSSIEQRLSSELGQPVSIGSLSSSWNWLDPTIVARDIVVVSENDRSDVAGSLKSVRWAGTDDQPDSEGGGDRRRCRYSRSRGKRP
jgi:hypothetical protein